MKLSRPIIWAGLALAIAAGLTLFNPDGEGHKSKSSDPQVDPGGNLDRLQVLSGAIAVPIFEFMTPKGDVKSLADYRGQVVLLNLWATWCAPCVAELPALDRLQAAMGGGEFTVLTISLDRQGAEKVAPFFEKLGIKHLPVFLDEKNASMQALKAGTLPISIIIGRDGQMLARLDGPAEWDSPEAKALIESSLKR